MSRRHLFIDGSSLFGGLDELLGVGVLVDFVVVYDELAEQYPCEGVYFYGTYLQVGKHPRKRVEAQRYFFNSAKRHPGVTFHQGSYSSVGKEKGIDVQMAVDIAIGAVKDRYDEVLVCSGDADLFYGYRIATEAGKPVILVTIPTRRPHRIPEYVTEEIRLSIKTPAGVRRGGLHNTIKK
jgi:uncharacterized LabA/DUF88 family protein